MRNHEVTEVQKLLTVNGTLKEPGWSRQLLQIYNREDIKAKKYRIKEWDYYLAMSKDFALAFTISDDGYIGLQSVSFLDFRNEPWEHTETILKPFPMGKLKMPPTSEKGDVEYEDKRLSLVFRKNEGKRHISCYFKDFYEGKPLSCELELLQPPMDTMVIATPWKEDPKAFYYNQKINCMRVKGTARFGDEVLRFDPETDFATLDWGRGVWTYDNTWYWGSGNTVVNGKPFGFNIGYGFGDTKAATENMIFYDGVGHKLEDITFCIPSDSYLKPWKITSNDDRFEMDFQPILDRSAKLDVKFILTDQHQVFGKMSGKAVLDDGTELQVKDMLCFCEKVHNKY